MHFSIKISASFTAKFLHFYTNNSPICFDNICPIFTTKCSLFFTIKFLQFLQQNILHFLHQNFSIFYNIISPIFTTKCSSFFTTKFLHFLHQNFSIFYNKISLFLQQFRLIIRLKIYWQPWLGSGSLISRVYDHHAHQPQCLIIWTWMTTGKITIEFWTSDPDYGEKLEKQDSFEIMPTRESTWQYNQYTYTPLQNNYKDAVFYRKCSPKIWEYGNFWSWNLYSICSREMMRNYA